MFGSGLPKNRRFKPEFFYYDPEKEEREGRRIQFKRNRLTKKTAKTRSLVWLIILFVLVLYALLYLGRIGAERIQ